MSITFLTAEWRHLLMLNYVVDPALLRPHLPAGVELDLHDGQALVSLVGFRFLHTRLLGVPIPGHRTFDELNLRFYVLRRMPGREPRRGVCFIREFVPRFAIAAVARTLYNEPYAAVPMRHELALAGPEPRVAYSIRLGGRWHTMHGVPSGTPVLATDDPTAAFITEHYWGYTDRGSGRTSEYEVRHPVWQVQPVLRAGFDGDAAAVYGAQWAEALSAPPQSALLAAGSRVSVHSGQEIAQ